MVIKRKQHSSRRPVKQGPGARAPRPNKIGAATPYHFRGKNLTPYGGLLPVATLLEKLGFQALLEETITTKRITRAMSPYQFVLALVLGLYVGFARLNQLRFIARDPILTGILQVTRLPPQSTLWRFLASLHLNVARQILSLQRQLRERVWAAAQVKLETVTLDTDTTVHTLYGRQMGGRKSYNPNNKGKRSYQPILTFLAETREYLMGGLRNGDRPTGRQIAAHLESAFRALPGGVKKILARADSGFYCWEAVAAYQQADCQFVIVARKTRRLVERLQQAEWKPAPPLRRGRAMRIPLPAARLGAGLSFPGAALRKRTRGRRGRAIPAVCHQRLHLPRVCHQPGRTDRCGGVVLQSAHRSREPDQGGQQRRRAGGPSVAPL